MTARTDHVLEPVPADRAGDSNGFAAAVARLAAGWDERQIEDDLLQVITEGAVQVIPGSQDAAIVVSAGPKLMKARSVHGSLPPSLMGLQNEVGQGPCLDAVSQPLQVRIDDLPRDSRWPLFTARASEWGVRSMLCTPLVHHTQILGSLCVASPVPDAFDDEALALIGVFATHAAIALSSARNRTDLVAALDSRDLIGQAKGILMERHRLTDEQAFAVLVRTSQDSNTKLRDVCSDLCLSGDLGTISRRKPPRV